MFWNGGSWDLGRYMSVGPNPSNLHATQMGTALGYTFRAASLTGTRRRRRRG